MPTIGLQADKIPCKPRCLFGASGMQERDLLSVLRLVALALDKHPTIFAGGQRGAVARLFARLLPICTEATRSRYQLCLLSTASLRVLPLCALQHAREQKETCTACLLLHNGYCSVPKSSKAISNSKGDRGACTEPNHHLRSFYVS